MNTPLKNKVVGCLFLSLLAGCKPMNAPSEPSSPYNADTDPVYQKNPHPTQAYRITMTIEDAPGPFEWISGTAFYEMTNRDACTPIDRSLGFSTKQKEDAIPIHFDKTSDTTYVATIYADGMIDADYYGKGMCTFELNGVGISLRATGKKEETRFQPSLFKKEIYSSAPKVTYFWKERYPQAGMDDFPDGGEVRLDQFNDNARKNTFKITLTTDRVRP
ncbi:hypothetical protein LN565_05020 [Xanthomonas euvesicatoria pv. euvesicatoria]|nr:hypothetical protein [Xanthomonas euvesicatoria]MBV6797163.1 hypothetical protein [Xanthomonas campestris pv. obscurae]MBV6805195.1 hypothetical protein [Xanthomonas campestris pv. convolvuli]MCC8501708.1 hypothetical protein [Xanthomonas euvesicatoria pv. euvesicatoria]MCC8517838.1 hypothetical protein [Xanthomonas euvesicatoria pv. euvesicatoria]MCC8540460.1 hypothetical protein [Xanthomonas euvesicatoria pv. euvesicatoria]